MLATDAQVRPKADTTAWRLAILAAGLEKLSHDWPGASDWPIAFAGLSGGAKRSCWIGAMLSSAQSRHLAGFFLAGMNDDRMSEALQSYPATPALLAAPVWMSCGRHDPVAPPEFQRQAEASLRHLGFQKVQLSQFDGEHEVDPSDLRRALRWFRAQGRF